MSAMEPRVRLGMVGGGQGAFIGGAHRFASRLDDRYELVAGALSHDAERAHSSSSELGIAAERSYASYAEMATTEAAREDGIEVVSIVTPNHLHADPVIVFAEAGIHVICDKPLTDTWNNACRVRDALKAHDTFFLLTHNYTGYPLVREARDLVRSGKLGEIRVVRAAYMQDWLTTDLEKRGFKQAEWRTDPARSGPAGSIGDIGSHAFQLIQYITGLKLESLAADLSTHIEDRRLDDHADILLRFNDGVKGSITCSQVSVGHENDLTVAIYCSNGSIRWAQENPNEMQVVCPYASPPQRYTRAAGVLGELATAAGRIPPGHPEGYLEAFAQLYRDAAEHIVARRNGGTATTAALPDLEDGIAGMAFIDAAVRSSNDDTSWTKPQQ